MEASHQPERLNQVGFGAFSERAGDGSPVVMLNLLSFRPDGGRARYEEYGAAVAPLLEGELHPMDLGGEWSQAR